MLNLQDAPLVPKKEPMAKVQFPTRDGRKSKSIQWKLVCNQGKEISPSCFKTVISFVLEMFLHKIPREQVSQYPLLVICCSICCNIYCNIRNIFQCFEISHQSKISSIFCGILIRRNPFKCFQILLQMLKWSIACRHFGYVKVIYFISSCSSGKFRFEMDTKITLLRCSSINGAGKICNLERMWSNFC